MITEQEALDEFLGLINDDPDFENQWFLIHPKIFLSGVLYMMI
jgi:hypothetical protein